MRATLRSVLLMLPWVASGRAGFPEPLLTLDCHKEEMKFTCSVSLFYKTNMHPLIVTLYSKSSSSEDHSRHKADVTSLIILKM